MANKEASFIIDDHYIAFLETQLINGPYQNPSEVVQAGLRLLEEQANQLAALRDALIEGEQSGTSSRDVNDIWNAVRKKGAPAS